MDYAIDGMGVTLLRTLETVKPFGLIASIGQVEARIDQIDVHELGPRRSLALARPSVSAISRAWKGCNRHRGRCWR